MIRSETFDVSRETFASARGKTVDDVEKNLAPHITDALNRLGLPSWESAIVAAALDIFDTAARAEVDEWNHVLDDMRDAFGHELGEALKNTKASDNPAAQAATLTRWVSTMALNAATEAATTSDTSAEVGLEWVTMHDGDVRSAHAAVNGQTVPTGHEFTVGGEKLLYPGQPVGDPANWINCVLGSAQVAWAGQQVQNATRRAYEGTLVHLTTAGSRVLTITPNHPVLTTAGYVPAGRLSPGDYVLAGGPVTPEVDDAPPSIEEVFSTLRDAGVQERVVGSAMDFHGDGTDAEVEIVGSDGNLPLPLRTKRSDASLIFSDVGEPGLVAPGAGSLPVGVTEGDIIGDLTAAGDMSRGGVRSALSQGEARIPDGHSFGATADLEAEFTQGADDGGAAEAEFGRHLEHALSVGMAPDEIISVKFDSGNHFVYNLHTSENYYSANGIAVHNCRCAVRPTMLGEMSVSRETLTAAGETEEPITSAVIVALPAESDPISAASSEADGAHCTLLFLGDVTALDKDALTVALGEFIDRGEVGVITDAVSGSAVLGPNKADVVLLDATNLVALRSGILHQDTIVEAFEQVEQFPTWIPHVTLGYPETPANAAFAGESVTFDRIALWFGEDRTAIYPLGETMPEKEPADVVTAAVEDPVPTPAQTPAEAPAGPTLRPWHGVLAPEGTPSGDGRQFAVGGLTNRDLPLPLKAMFTDDEGHKGSVIVGRIDNIFRDEATSLMKGEGVFDDTPDADRAYAMVEKKMWRGVSVDVDSADIAMTADGDPVNPEVMEFATARIASATMCAIPAFAEAFVALGTWAENADQTAPERTEGEVPDEPSVSIIASAAPSRISADYFRNPMLTEPTAVTRGEDGLVFGHLAAWETCHIAYEVCTTAPASETDYAYFLTGQVFTDAGPVAVGQLTVGGGHADGKLGVRAAMAHYDNVATAVADITVGEDAFGIWFSGRLRPWATEQQIHELFAAAPSGDWRGVRFRGSDSMELVAAHAVNVQGFPVPRASMTVDGGRQMSLVAAGVVIAKPEKDADDFDSKMDAYFARKERAALSTQFKSNIRTARIADLKKKLITRKGK